MKKLLKSKGGFNDVTIVMTIITIFFFTAAIIPFVNASFTQSYVQFDQDGVAQDQILEGQSANSLNAFSLLTNVLQLALWDFGDNLGLPWWLDVFYSLLGVALVLTIARNVWIGGGS